MRTFVINLDRARERRARMQATLDHAGIAFEFFPAVDGHTNFERLSREFDVRSSVKRLARQLGPGEVGCWASHRRLWEMAVNWGEPILVMEDDIELGPEFCAVRDAAAPFIADSGIIRFSGRRLTGTVLRTAPGGWSLVRFPRRLVALACYAISPEAAERLMKFSTTWSEPVDEFVDRFWVHGTDIIGVLPFPAWQTVEGWTDSSIATDRENKVRSTAKIWREIVRMGDEFGRNTANIAAIPRLAGKPRYRPR